MPHFYSFGYQVIKLTYLLLILYNLSSRPMNLVGNGLVWRCWHDVRSRQRKQRPWNPAVPLSVVNIWWYAEMVEAADFTFPKLAALARSVLAVPATSVPSERVFSALSSTQRDHHWPLQGLTKLYVFMKTIVLLQHLKTTKLGYRCILYPCLCWYVELELVGCRAAKLVMMPDLLSYGLWNYNFTGYLYMRRNELLTKPYSRSFFCILAVT